MCGIFGIINYGDRRYMADLDHIKELTADLLSASQTRGSDASGICIVTNDNKAMVLKARRPGSQLPVDPKYASIMQAINYQTNFRMMIGHTRAKTKGTKYKNVNNHPIVAGRVVGVHNGMISNDDALFDMNKKLKRAGEVDSEVIFRLIDFHMTEKNHTITSAVRTTANALVGSYSCAFIHLDKPNYLTLFAGTYANIAIQDFRKHQLMAFASTDSILTDACKGHTLFESPSSKREVGPNTSIRINVKNGRMYTFETDTKVGSHVSNAGFPPAMM